MTGAPSLPEAEKAVAEAKAHLDVAAGAADPVVQRDRFKQAAQRLGYDPDPRGAGHAEPP